MQNTVQQERWLRLGQAAKVLGFSYDITRRLAQEGRFTTRTTPGGQTIVPAHEVETYARECTTPALEGVSA